MVLLDFDYVSPFPIFFFCFIVIVGLTIFIVASIKRHRLANLLEANYASLSLLERERLNALRRRDRAWFELTGNALDGVDLVDPISIAIDAGWVAMDDAEEILKSKDFVTSLSLRVKFTELLSLAEMQFNRADDEQAKLPLDTEE